MRAAANRTTFTDQQGVIMRMKKEKVVDRKEMKKLIEIGDQLTAERDEAQRKYSEAIDNAKALKVLAEEHVLAATKHLPASKQQVAELEEMYHPDLRDVAGRDRQDDLMMFGYYIYNNIGIAFRTFAGGLLLGVGALVAMLFNGSFFGAAAGHLTLAGAAQPFFTFVIAHGAPELIAIFLAGGAGLRMGWAVLAPGSWRRVDALRRAASRTCSALRSALSASSDDRDSAARSRSCRSRAAVRPTSSRTAASFSAHARFSFSRSAFTLRTVSCSSKIRCSSLR